MSTITVKWVDSKLMLGVDSRGVPIVVSSMPERVPKWLGLKPSDLLLISAASCSMYDVIGILQKQRMNVVDLEVVCDGVQLEEPPYKFTHIHLKYIVKGNITAEKLERAINLSQDKYCSVLATIRPGVEISHEYEIVSDT